MTGASEVSRSGNAQCHRCTNPLRGETLVPGPEPLLVPQPSRAEQAPSLTRVGEQQRIKKCR
jgi:hypothetical protein